MQKITIDRPDKLFFSSDHHFDHKAIVDSCSRPFTDVSDMNIKLRQLWNDTVPTDGLVIYLGDLTMKGAVDRYIYLFRKLNGKILFFVNGNHDNKFMKAPFVPSGDMAFVRVLDPAARGGVQEIHCCHYPILHWYKKHYGSWHLFGHSHGNAEHPSKLCWDVGVDNNEYKPISYLQLKNYFNQFTI